MVETGKFYTRGHNDLIQILQTDGRVAFVKDWNLTSAIANYIIDTEGLRLRCLSDAFVAFVVGQGEE